MDTFWHTIGLYNTSTWILQVVLIILGMVCTGRVIYRPSRSSTILLKLFMVVLYLWIAVVYFHIYCSARSYNNIMATFWVVLALAWVWDLCTRHTTFDNTENKHKLLALLLLLLPLVYPLTSIIHGRTFPEITSPIMPCSVVVYTFGMLLYRANNVNIFIVLLLCHWSMIGLSKTFYFNIPEDYLLVGAAVPSIYYFFRGYFLDKITGRSKPNKKVLHWLLLCMCIAIGCILATTFILDLTHRI